jgi:exosortase A-associated hydrolase 1
MSDVLSKEIPLVFQCEGETLVGVVHRPVTSMEIGVLTIIAGGPQFRGGVGRGMVSTARDLADRGVPVMRFDQRGLGDSGGDFLGFEYIAEDIQAAVRAFQSAVPEVKKVVLWGGCDAASAAMIHGWKVPDVISLVLGNPWVTTAETHSAVMKQHYLSRLREWSFWRKLIRFEFNLVEYTLAGIKKVGSRAGSLISGQGRAESNTDNPNSENFVDKMLGGLGRFNGSILFLMSGQSLLSREFDELVSSNSAWNSLYQNKGCKRIDFPDADQTFSDSHSRQCVNKAISD